MRGVCTCAIRVWQWGGALGCVQGALNGHWSYPWILQLMPGDNSADEHTEAHSALHIRVNKTSTTNPGAQEKDFSSFFCNSTSISHLSSAGGGRNKSVLIWGFFLASSSVMSQDPREWRQRQGMSVVVYHQPNLATTEIILLPIGSSVVSTPGTLLCSKPQSSFKCPLFSSFRAICRHLGSSRGSHTVLCWSWGTLNRLSQACLAAPSSFFPSSVSLGLCLGKWPSSSLSLDSAKLYGGSLIHFFPCAGYFLIVP